MDTALLILILVTGFYTAWNIGANDVANAMGTSVGSGAFSLKRAVIFAAILEFSGAFFFGSHVSKTMQSGIINADLFANDPRILVYGMPLPWDPPVFGCRSPLIMDGRFPLRILW